MDELKQESQELEEPRYLAAEIRNRYPNIPGYFITNLKNKGFIHPKKIDRGRRPSYKYSEMDAQLINKIWEYREDGLTLEAAYKKAVNDIKQPEISFKSK